MKTLTSIFLLLPIFAIADVVVPIDKVEDSVNIRLNADTGSDVVGELRQGESMPLVGSTDGWHEVQLEGDSTGFVSSDWSQIVTDAEVVPDEELAVEEAVEEAAEEAAEEVTEAVVEEAVVAAVEEAVEVPVEEGVEEALEAVVEVAAVDAVEAAAEQLVEEPAEEAVPEPEPVVELEPEVEVEPELAAEPVAEETVVVPVPEPEVAPTGDVKGDRDFVVKVRRPGELVSSQIFDNGNRVGIGATDPQQRLEVNGSIQIHDQNSSVAGLMITQSSGDTGYVMHNRASTLTIGAGSIDRITIDRDGHVGFGVARPAHPLEMASGAHVTAGGVWTNRSSRESKENIVFLSSDDAVAAVMALQPVSFNYTAERGEDYVGFIAEDVPALLASSDRESLSTMDVVAALTRVVQEQQRRIEMLEAKLHLGQP